MDAAALTIVDATSAHLWRMVRIERQSRAGSLVEVHALGQALARGHCLIVALASDQVVGWIWFAAGAGRGGEDAGQIFRVAVDAAQRCRGVGRALIAHAHDVLRARGCERIRVTLDAADGGARGSSSGSVSARSP